LTSITQIPENPEDIWVHINYPEDENLQIEIGEFSSDLATDILLNYGYSIMVLPE
jgi:phenylpyruvate tautomerase PptA (4-oxalocrotonate tautomerase family)